jgi:ABC-type lipoprotein export system ATPase subunit
MDYVIEVKNLTKSYKDGKRDTKAIDNLSFTLPKGESMAIVGTSGSGKTTLLHMLGGLDYPSKGDVLIDGKPLKKFKDSELSHFRNKTIGFVFQFFYLQDYMTVEENVAIPMLIAGKKRKDALQKARELLSQFGMNEYAHKSPKELSGGQIQRVAVARALSNDPKIILADEPTGNLDRENADKVLEIFNHIAKTGVSVVVITHDEKISDRYPNVLRLDKGRLVR